jgi:prepilin-type N-terminal cleavage/methylation domain-containing protein
MTPSLDKSRYPLQAAFRRLRRTARNQRGFTLVEALVATMILAGGMVAVAQLLVVSLQMHHLGRRTSEASKLATAKLEELMKLNFETGLAIAITPSSPDALSQNVTNYFDTTTAGYTRRWKVEAGPVADTRRITLRVIPPIIDLNRFRTIEVVTILRRW